MTRKLLESIQPVTVRPMRYRAALYAAGAAFAQHVKVGDHWSDDDLTSSLVEKINYTLRTNGLVLRRITTPTAGWLVEPNAPPVVIPPINPFVIPADVWDGLQLAIGLVEAGGTAELVGKHHPTAADERKFEKVTVAGQWLACQKRSSR